MPTAFHRRTWKPGRQACKTARRRHRKKGKKKKLNIYEVLGYALGCIGLSYDDFCRLTPEEFGAVSKAYQEYREAEYRGEWERMRLLATITIQPHVKKKMTPQALLPFEWDRQKPKAEFVSKDEDKKRLERRMKNKIC